MYIDSSSEDEIGSEVLSNTTFVGNQSMDFYPASPHMDFSYRLKTIV